MTSDVSVTFFVLATNETETLYKTVCGIKENCPPENLSKIVIVLRSDNCPSYEALKKFKQEESWSDIQSYVQKSDRIEDMFAELPPMVSGTHFVFMASDMEMNPATIADFVREAKKNPECIVAASKWVKGSVVEGYKKFHEFCSRTMNLIACLLIRKRASDMFSFFQIYPLSVYKAMKFNDPKRFGYEYTLKPLRLGVEYKEVPTIYINSSDDKTNFNFFHRAKFLLVFIFTALRIGFTPKKYLLKE